MRPLYATKKMKPERVGARCLGVTTPKELLGKVVKGKPQLPDFQRGWVWDEARQRETSGQIPLMPVAMTSARSD